MNIYPRLLLPSLAFIFLAACAGKEPPPTSHLIEHQENLKTEANQARLVQPATKVVGKANEVAVREIRTQTVNGRLLVDYVLFNDRGRRDVVNYRVRWLDPNGMTISQYDPWESVALEGHEQAVLSVSAPTVAATDFRIELKTNQ
jgi:uncharacterized protein YcfL